LYTLGEKLVVFIEYKKRDPSALRPQDDEERLNGKHKKKGNLICHSEAREESYNFAEFLTRSI
jgi:hypothetical protein